MTHSVPMAVVARIRSSRTLPTMPGVALRIVQLCQDEDVSVADIAQTIQQDPALSARILRYANGASYGASGSVTTVRRAAALLGATTLQTLALSFSLVASMQATKVKGFDHRRYWLRGLFCAASAQAVATSRGMHSPEVYFVTALLQDLGMLVLAHALGDEYAAVVDQAGQRHDELVASERIHFGFDHGDVTAWLAREWSLPPVFAGVAEASHGSLLGDPSTPLGIGPSMASPILLSSYVADIFCVDDVALACQRAEALSYALFGMGRDDFAGVLAHATTVASAGASLLTMDPGPPGNIARILEAARGALKALVSRVPERARPVCEVSLFDPLTGLWTRTHLEARMEEWLLEAKGGGGPLVVAMCDVDGLGAVNAAYGQAVGDDVLSTVANRLARALQRDGAIGRYGGEEFVVVLPKADLGEAERMCERLRDSVDSRPVDTRDGRQVPATISIGVAATGGSVNSVPALVQAAYGALADAQRSGKNRVCSTFPPTDGTSSHPASAGEP